MAKEPIPLPSLYLDSCCFIDVVKHKLGKRLGHTQEEHLRRLKEVWVYKKMLQASIDRKLRVFTSAQTQIECTTVDGDFSEEVQTAFMQLFSAANLIIPVQPTNYVNELARALKWQHKIVLNPMDSLHVASALAAGAKEFITTDGGGIDSMKPKSILKNAALIERLGLRVTLATGTLELPQEYRMDDLFPKAEPSN